jgi:hypothetical protein
MPAVHGRGGASSLLLRVGVCTEGARMSSDWMYTGRWSSPSNPIYLYMGGGVAPPIRTYYTSIMFLRLAAGASTRGHWCSGGGPPVRPEAQTRCLPECSMTAGLHGVTGVQTEGRLCGPKSKPGALHWRPAAGCDFENLLRLRAVVWRPKQHKTEFCSCQHVASRAGDRLLTTSSLLCGSCNQGGCRFACELFDSSPPPPWP